MGKIGILFLAFEQRHYEQFILNKLCVQHLLLLSYKYSNFMVSSALRFLSSNFYWRWLFFVLFSMLNLMNAGFPLALLLTWLVFSV